MAKQQEFNASARLLLVAAAVVIVVAGAKAAAGLLVLLLLAVFVAVITTPVFMALKKWKLGTGTALLIMVFALFVLGFGLVVVVTDSLRDLASGYPALQQAINLELARGVSWLGAHGVDISQEQVNEWFRPGAALAWVGNTLRTASGLVGQFFVVFLIVVFIWVEAAFLPAKLDRMVESGTIQHLQRALEDVRRYVGLKTVMSLLTAFLAGIWCLIMGVDYVLVWATAAFVLNFVPTIGSVVAAIPPVLLALVTGGFSNAVILGIGYVAINVGVSNGIEPRFMGKGLGLSPLVVVLSMIVWGWVLGPVGMLLSIPLTTVVKIWLEANEDTRWMAVILGGDVPAERVTMRTKQAPAVSAD
ncbi:MAG: AI-2E family transporter [Planctomycetota bacterium]|jgi:AI-2 transport protein TqsA|nr:AI-2E family transporter [Planctomycetota bacterium]